MNPKVTVAMVVLVVIMIRWAKSNVWFYDIYKQILFTKRKRYKYFKDHMVWKMQHCAKNDKDSGTTFKKK